MELGGMMRMMQSRYLRGRLAEIEELVSSSKFAVEVRDGRLEEITN